MKIGILIISDTFSGAERAVYSILECISKYPNIKIQLFVNKEIYGNYSCFTKLQKFNLGGTSSKNILIKRVKLLFSRRKFNSLIKSNNFDFLSIHMFPSPEIIEAIYKNSLKYSITLHGSEIKTLRTRKDFFYRKVIAPVFNKFLNNCLSIISVSHHQIQNLPEKYKKKTVVIPNGVDSEKFKPLKNIKQKKNVILFTGRLIDIKGIREIVSVAKQLPQYEFWFAGQGPLTNLINLPNTKNLGFKKTEELVKLYNQATICIFPSYREGFPLCGLEAMSCSRAVIATPLGFSEYIDDKKDGIIIPAKNEKALKDAIVDLMENPKKRKMLEKNARKKAPQYSWDKIAKQYMKVFEDVVKQSKRNKIISSSTYNQNPKTKQNKLRRKPY